MGHKVDRPQRLVITVRFGLTGNPVQDEVRRRHKNHIPGISVEWVFTWPQGTFPHTAFTFGHSFAVAERRAGKVAAQLTYVTHHDADVSNRHDRFRLEFNGGKPSIDEVGAVGQSRVLA